MEAQQGKPKVSYADFIAQQPKMPKFENRSVAWFIDKRIAESEKPGARPLLGSHRYILKAMQRMPIGAVMVKDLAPTHLIDHCRLRKATPSRHGKTPKPQTVRQDIVYLRSTIRTFVDMDELPVEALNVFTKANRILRREQLVGKGQPRERRPEPGELERIFGAIDAGQFKIPMRALVEFSLVSGRRIGETCKLLWADLDEEKRTCLVRDLKNSAGKGFHGEFPLLGSAWDIVMAQPRVTPYIFSFRMREDKPWKQIVAKSAGAAYTRIKKDLGIPDLRLHDNRAECFTRMFEVGYSVPEVQQVSQHKGDAKTLLVHYTRLRPESLHQGPASKRAAR